MKQISHEKLINNLELNHIQRYRDTFVDPKLNAEFRHRDRDMIETRIKYKGATIITVFTQILKENRVRIDVQTNRKFIKKHKLPYNKTKVVGDPDFVFDTEIQLKLGPAYVRKVMYAILREVEDKFNHKVKKIVSERCNGIFMNSGTKHTKDRNCSFIIKEGSY